MELELEPNTRLFLVVGKNAEPEMLTEAFKPFGVIQSVKVVREKGVAYIKYEKASSAASAIENMHEKVLNEGRGPMVKVMFAESPKASAGKRVGGRSNSYFDCRGPPDPDNVPPLSRLFIVVPKTADGDAIQKEMAAFSDMQYCKTDLIASKGIVYCKYSKSSSALRALETVQESSMVAGYKVKCMLAEPKGKRGRLDAGPGHMDPASPMHPASQLSLHQYMMRSFPGGLNPALTPGGLYGGDAVPNSAAAAANNGGSFAHFAAGNGGLLPGTPTLATNFLQNLAAPLSPSSVDSGAMHSLGLSGLTGLQALAAIQGAANLDSPTTPSADLLSLNGQAGFGGLGSLSQAQTAFPSLLNHQQANEASSSRGNNVLRVATHPNTDQASMNELLFGVPGLTGCELQRDPVTGLSQCYALVTFVNAEAAAMAATQIHGVEFPGGSGFHLQVAFVEGQSKSASMLSTGSLGAIGDGHSMLPRLRTRLNDEETEALDIRMSSLSSESSSGAAHTTFSHMAPMSQMFPPPQLTPTSEVESSEEQNKACTLLSVLQRPVPAIMIQQLLSTLGGVEDVSLLPDDERVGVVRFSTPTAAATAIKNFNGATICGETLRLLPSKLLPPPMLGA